MNREFSKRRGIGARALRSEFPRSVLLLSMRDPHKSPKIHNPVCPLQKPKCVLYMHEILVDACVGDGLRDAYGWDQSAPRHVPCASHGASTLLPTRVTQLCAPLPTSGLLAAPGLRAFSFIALGPAPIAGAAAPAAPEKPLAPARLLPSEPAPQPASSWQ